LLLPYILPKRCAAATARQRMRSINGSFFKTKQNKKKKTKEQIKLPVSSFPVFFYQKDYLAKYV
jgi:hypothetical protein